LALDLVEAVDAVHGHRHLVAGLLQHGGDGDAHHVVVVDEQNPGHERHVVGTGRLNIARPA
jgi:hypothetical protein